jgi:hypothetical protein
VIHGECRENNVFKVYRGTTLIGGEANNLYGVAPVAYDVDTNSTMSIHVIEYVDLTAGIGNHDYKLWVEGDNNTFFLNRTFNGALSGFGGAFERAISTGGYTEITK